MNKPKILIIGHARHGKDTVAELIQQMMKLSFTSSSLFVAKECVWDTWGKERYHTFDAFYADRVNYRTTWKNLIRAYNTPNLTRTATTMLSRGYDMYVGMRDRDEFEANMKDKVFDVVVWVDASSRHPDEEKSSMELNSMDADYYIDNDGDLDDLKEEVKKLQENLALRGFDVNYSKPVEDVLEGELLEPELGDRLDWTDAPVGSIMLLDHGFIRTVEHMGTDDAIAESARMSYGRGTKKKNNNQGLINYLVRNYHTSPLEMGEIKFHMRLPIFVMRQLVRHRTANLNEYSGRYSEMVRLFYTPELSKIMCQSDGPNKQMSGEPLPKEEAKIAQLIIRGSSNKAFDNYEKLLSKNVSRETARIVLPLNTYTEVVWKMDVSNLIKFLYLRDDDHAQWEIRVYAIEIAKAVEKLFPNVYAAYMRERDSVKLTPLQIDSLIAGKPSPELSKSETAQVEKLLQNNLIGVTL